MKLEEMPDHARLWVYQASRQLSEEEVQIVERETRSFISSWAAHGQALTASFEVKYDQFLVIAVDESAHSATGCSIDDSVNLVRKLEQLFNTAFLDRTKVALLDEDQIEMIPFNQIKSAVSEGAIVEKSKIFNNSVSTYGDFKQNWIQSASESWVSRYFN